MQCITCYIFYNNVTAFNHGKHQPKCYYFSLKIRLFVWTTLTNVSDLSVLVLSVFLCKALKFTIECIKICVLSSWQKLAWARCACLLWKTGGFIFSTCPRQHRYLVSLPSYLWRNVCHRCIQIRECPPSPLLGVPKHWLGTVVPPALWSCRFREHPALPM